MAVNGIIGIKLGMTQIFLEDLRHPQLDSDNPVNRHCLLSLFRSMS